MGAVEGYGHKSFRFEKIRGRFNKLVDILLDSRNSAEFLRGLEAWFKSLCPWWYQEVNHYGGIAKVTSTMWSLVLIHCDRLKGKHMLRPRYDYVKTCALKLT